MGYATLEREIESPKTRNPRIAIDLCERGFVSAYARYMQLLNNLLCILINCIAQSCVVQRLLARDCLKGPER